jgi:hypothetical protein
MLIAQSYRHQIHFRAEFSSPLVDPRDLGALKAKPGHQTLLIEGKA